MEFRRINKKDSNVNEKKERFVWMDTRYIELLESIYQKKKSIDTYYTYEQLLDDVINKTYIKIPKAIIVTNKYKQLRIDYPDVYNMEIPQKLSIQKDNIGRTKYFNLTKYQNKLIESIKTDFFIKEPDDQIPYIILMTYFINTDDDLKDKRKFVYPTYKEISNYINRLNSNIHEMNLTLFELASNFNIRLSKVHIIIDYMNYIMENSNNIKKEYIIEELQYIKKFIAQINEDIIFFSKYCKDIDNKNLESLSNLITNFEIEKENTKEPTDTSQNTEKDQSIGLRNSNLLCTP